MASGVPESRGPGPLTDSELSARRAVASRRQARRRAALMLVLSIAVVGAVVAAVIGGSDGSARRPVTTASAAPAVVSPQAQPDIGRRHVIRPDRAIDRLLAATPYVKLAGRRRREVALTFDDGPGPSTSRILRILERAHAPATFFVIGRSARAHPDLVAQEARAGFVIGDHTETHAALSRLTPAEQDAEISAGARDIQRAGAPYPRLFRPPYGSFDSATLALLRGRRMLLVLWSADTKDFSRPGVERIVYTGISGAQPGAIVLMHDGGGDRNQTAAALPRIIARLRERHFRLVTIPQLITDDPPPGTQPPPTPLSGHG